MSDLPLEDRVLRLERLVEDLLAGRLSEPPRDAWRSTIGAFHDDPVAKEIIDEALRLRKEERRQARLGNFE